MLVKQIQVINEARDAKEDAQAKYRASHPRKAKSRPTSSVQPIPVNVLILSRSPSPDHSDEDIIRTPDLINSDIGKSRNHQCKLTHFILETHKRAIGKQCKHRRGV